MNAQTRSKWIAYGTLIFLTGALSGAVVAWSQKHSFSPRSMPPGGPSGKFICERLKSSLVREFNLSPEQITKIEPILLNRASAYDEVFERSRRDLAALAEGSNRELAQALALTPEQAAKIEELARPKRPRPGGPPGGGGRRGEPSEDRPGRFPPGGPGHHGPRPGGS